MNTFLHWIQKRFIALIIGLLAIIIIGALFFETTETPPVLYATQDTTLQVTQGKAVLVRDKTRFIKTGESVTLQVGDKIKTLVGSQATIFWTDGSITRLSEKTALTISTLSVSKDLSSIQIRFDTESGKTWSNVIRALLPDSFFEQTYDHGSYVATVRGTVFELNLDKHYLHAVSHAVGVKNTKTGESAEVLQGDSIDTLSLNEIGAAILDAAWEKFNDQEDIKYLNSQLRALSENIAASIKAQKGWPSWKKRIIELVTKKQNINDILANMFIEQNSGDIQKLKDAVANANTPAKKAAVHAELLSYYQATGVLPDSEDHLALRQTLRDLLIDTAPEGEKKRYEDSMLHISFGDYLSATKAGLTAKADELKAEIEKKAQEQGIVLPGLEELKKRAATITLENISNQVQNNVNETINSIQKTSINTDELKNAANATLEKAKQLLNSAGNAAVKGLLK